MKIWLILAVVVGAAAPPARADVVVLRNGVRLEGLVEQAASGDGTWVQVAQDGYVALDPETVVSVQRESPARNARLAARWKADARRQAEQERQERLAAKAAAPAPASEAAPAPAEEPPPPPQIVVNSNVQVQVIDEPAVLIGAPLLPLRPARRGPPPAPLAQFARPSFDVSSFGAFGRSIGQ